MSTLTLGIRLTAHTFERVKVNNIDLDGKVELLKEEASRLTNLAKNGIGKRFYYLRHSLTNDYLIPSNMFVKNFWCGYFSNKRIIDSNNSTFLFILCLSKHFPSPVSSLLRSSFLQSFHASAALAIFHHSSSTWL